MTLKFSFVGRVYVVADRQLGVVCGKGSAVICTVFILPDHIKGKIHEIEVAPSCGETLITLQ